MREGSIVGSGSAADVVDTPQQLYIRTWLLAILLADVDLDWIFGSSASSWIFHRSDWLLEPMSQLARSPVSRIAADQHTPRS
jgi:hypothetical protein